MPGSLEDRIHRSGNVAEMLRNCPAGAYTYPMKPEYSNWRDEQRAWATTAVLFDQSYHMTDVYFRGPDALRLLSDLGVNSFKTFAKNKAKQFVACNYDGYVIGDAILFGLDDEEFSLVGRPIAPDWVAFHAETGGQPIDRIKFFNIGEFTIAGCTVKALNHTMSGIPGQEMTGLEMMGPSERGTEVMAALLAAGKEFGLREGGNRAYPTTAIESGWIPSPLPAIYTGEQMKPFREWLSEDSWEANASIGGSFASGNIEDYYLTPWDLGYGHVVKFDHDFIGRSALERLASQPHKRKVWLRWNDDDVARIIASSLFGGEQRAKYMDMPSANYATGPYDKVLIGDRLVGFSANVGYTVNIGGWSSLAMVEEADAIDGTEVTLVWGEENGGSAKPSVERHVQTEIRATIAPAPIADVARNSYRPSAKV